MFDKEPKSEEVKAELMTTETMQVAAALEKANIDVAVATAHQYPRNIGRCKDQALAIATLDEETAAQCFYNYQRGGKEIEGPSIRAAEIVASTWGNLRYGSRVIGHDGKNVKAQAFCHDLESNVMMTVEVDRKITDKRGNTFSEDMITVTGNAAAAIARRNAVFGAIPQALVKSVCNAAKALVIGDGKSMSSRIDAAMTRLAKLGIDEERILATLGVPSVEQITPKHLERLYGSYTAIRDGETPPEDAFPPIKAAAKAAATPEEPELPGAGENKGSKK